MLFNLNPNSSVNIAEDIRGAKTTTLVSATSTVGVALASNPVRATYNIFNAGTVTAFVREGAVVTSALYDFQIPPGFLYKEEFSSARYLGVVSAITASGTTSLLVSEGSLI
jgi:hypothetical protein